MCTNFWITPHNGKLPSRLAPAQYQNSLTPQLLSNIYWSKTKTSISLNRVYWYDTMCHIFSCSYLRCVWQCEVRVPLRLSWPYTVRFNSNMPLSCIFNKSGTLPKKKTCTPRAAWRHCYIHSLFYSIAADINFEPKLLVSFENNDVDQPTRLNIWTAPFIGCFDRNKYMVATWISEITLWSFYLSRPASHNF